MYNQIKRHPERFDEISKYQTAVNACKTIKKNARIETDVFGLDNLPTEGGYIMYPNHQGKYDAVGIVVNHQSPCSVVVDEARSHMPILTQFIDIVDGKRLDKHDIKGQVRIIKEVAKEVSSGRKYIIFPEGGYENVTSNEVYEFMAGSFKAATISKCPIVPVALIDSYKPFSINSLKKVRTQIHYLPAIYFDEYKYLNTNEIADLVKSKIVNKINEVLV